MGRHRHRIFGVAPLALLVAIGGCGQPQREGRGGQASTEVVSPATVLARVNGKPILEPDLVHQMQSGESREQALRSLIRQELLAQEAVRRGLDRDPGVLDQQRRAMVELLVRRMFRDGVGPAQVPRAMVEKAYKLNLGLYQHPELVNVSHILASATKRDSPATHEAARRLAERAHELATKRPLTADQFVAIGAELAPEAGPVNVRTETFRTPLRGVTVAPFADAAFALARAGAVSPVVKTSFGYHVIYLRERIPAVNVSLEQAEPEIRRRILEEARTDLLLEFIDGLEKKLAVRLQPENLTPAGREATP